MATSARTVFVLLGLVFIGVVVGSAILSGEYFEDTPISTLEQAPLTTSANQKMAQFLTEKAIDEYILIGSLEGISDNLVTNFANDQTRYVFVIDYDTQLIASHPDKTKIGSSSYALINSHEPYDEIMNVLKTKGYSWISYDFLNPDDGNVEPKMSWLQLHDNYIFGSGFYVPMTNNEESHNDDNESDEESDDD